MQSIPLNRRTFQAVLLLATTLLLPPAIARAQSEGTEKKKEEEKEKPKVVQAIPDRFRLRIGTLFATVNSDAQVNTELANGTEIDFENVLDLPTDDTSLRIDGFWRIAGRHSIEFGYMDISRDADGVVLDREIEFAGETFPVSASVDSHFDTSYIFAAYRYDFIRKPKMRFGGVFGATYTDLSAGIKGDVTVGGQTVEREADTSVSVPVPLLGVAFNHTPNKYITWDAYARGFYYSSGGFEGNAIDVGARIEWYFTKHFGIGGDYEITRLSVPDYDDGDRDGSAHYNVNGFRFFLCFTF